ncbi:MAG: hypothetical protein HOO96_26560 [Polyangiaceae bacterium]|nr:hypothetical protein [Polyangiaceae bacterium]
MSRFVRKSIALLVVGSMVMLGVACKAKVGGSCKPGKDTCSDGKTALHCGKDNKYVEVKCAGPLGCLKLGSHMSCDDSVGDVDQPCMGESEEEYACSANKKKAVVCKDGKYSLHLECRGPKGCSMIGKMLNCDNTIAEKGDPCTKPGNYSCSVDAKNMFICKDGKWDVWRYCRGRDACQVKLSEVSCDVSISEMNDPCGVPGSLACSTDGKLQLICRGGKFVQDRECKKQGCNITNAKRIECQ